MAIRLGTRGSALAVAQAMLVRERLAELGEEAELVRIRTSGDVGGEAARTGAAPRGDAAPRAGAAAVAGLAPPAGQDKSRFVREIEDALRAGRVDLAVHSAKDVPSELPDGLAIVGVPERVDARDALCGQVRTLDALASGVTVGTASLRRRAQLLAARPDLDVRALRGNVDTRLRRLAEGELEAIVLAAAGLDRLGRDEGTPIPEELMTPAPGQGCLALEARSDDARMREMAALLTHHESLTALLAERALVTGIGATCRTPVGAHARVDDGTLRIDSFAGRPDGSTWIRDSLTGDADEPVALGTEAADRLITAGAAEVLAGAERWGGE